MSQRDEIKQLLKRRIATARNKILDRTNIQKHIEETLAGNKMVIKATALKTECDLANEAFLAAQKQKEKAGSNLNNFLKDQIKRMTGKDPGNYAYETDFKRLIRAEALNSFCSSNPDVKRELERIARLENSLGDLLILATSEKQIRQVVNSISTELNVEQEFNSLLPEIA
jgi:hypothetical protein